MTSQPQRSAVDPLLALDPRTGEFAVESTERAFREEMIDATAERLSGLALVLALLMTSLTLVDLGSLGVSGAWLALLLARAASSAGLIGLSVAVKRNPRWILHGVGARLLVLEEIGVMAAFLAVCIVRPEDAITHSVSAILISLVIGVYVPGRARTKAILVTGFQAAFLAVGVTRFEAVEAAPLTANLIMSLMFIAVFAVSVNRSHRIEWRVTRTHRRLNEELMDEARRAELMRAELERQATLDALTGLANRRHFFDRGDAAVAQARNQGERAFAVVMDADRFKQVNDRYGHGAGDAVLRSVGDALRATVRDCEVVGRIGGEEFAAVVVGVDPSGAVRLAERMCESVRSTGTVYDDDLIGLTISVGVAEIAEDEDLAVGLGRADGAMYEAKRAGGNQVRCRVSAVHEVCSDSARCAGSCSVAEGRPEWTSVSVR